MLIILSDAVGEVNQKQINGLKGDPKDSIQIMEVNLQCYK